MKTYNISIHEGTKYTPHELVFGKAARVSTSSILPDDKNGESYPEYAIRYLIEFLTHKQRRAKILIERKLGLSNTTTVRRTRRYSKRMIIYIC